MDIRDVGVDLNRTSRGERKAETRAGSATNKTAQAVSKHDFFENSGRLGEVRALIDALVQVPEFRADAVENAKALLASGELDSPERAAQAAEGLLGLTEGFEG
ncbi:MAG: hypothetical protein H6807_13850 [Planctomycetes bacterium]|nr:hypothetical protein [Planctomycetota bacterium]